MPTYEYRCRDCGHSFDIVQRMSDEPLTHCPKCGGDLRKVFAPPAISFKGSGFYATDHGKKSKPSTESKGKDGSDTKGDTKKESAGSGSGSAPGATKSDAPSSSSSSNKKDGSS
jgi:putative FmdB family regulatory protein